MLKLAAGDVNDGCVCLLQRDAAGCDQHAAQHQQPPGGVHHPHHEEVGQGQPGPGALEPVLTGLR